MGSFSLLLGNCLDVLSTLPESSVQCCVTSPPYWGLRNYGVDGQLGLEETPDAYVANMVAVFRAVRRVLRDDGTLWLNLGDSYSGAAGGNNRGEGAGGGKERGKAMGFGTLPKRKDLEGGLKHKDLAGIPWRVAFALQADGWWLRQDIIWHKPNPMPESVTDRCTKAHEYIFLLTKSARYYYDNEAVKEPQICSDPRLIKSGIVRSREYGYSTKENELRTGNRKYDDVPINYAGNGTNVKGHKGNSMNTLDGKRNKRSVWTVSTKPFKGAHFATFPPDLIEPCILAGSAAKCCAVCYAPWERVVKQGLPAPEPAHRNPTKRLEPGQAGNADAGNMGFRASKLSGQEMSKWKAENPDRTVGWEPTCECGGETQPSMVLDPFSGAGTTGAVAVQHGRRYIGIELNPDYLEMSRKRIQLVRDGLTVPMFV